MATKVQGRVVLRGRFSPGTHVRLYEASGPEQMRPVGPHAAAAEAVVDEDGCVAFPAEPGGYYFISGIINGEPKDVRIRGRAAGDHDTIHEYAPEAPVPTRRSDGTPLQPSPAENAERVKRARAALDGPKKAPAKAEEKPEPEPAEKATPAASPAAAKKPAASASAHTTSKGKEKSA